MITLIRFFYCPAHGRVTEDSYRRDCAHCEQWYNRRRRVSAKRSKES